MKVFIRFLVPFFLLLTLIGCSDNNKNLVKLNGQTIKISDKKFIEIESLFASDESFKKCKQLNSLFSKLSDFFKGFGISFDKEDHSVEIKNVVTGVSYKLLNKNKNLECSITEMSKSF